MKDQWPIRDFPVQKVGAKIKTNLERVVWRLAHNKRDHEVAGRWVLRAARRLGAVPVDDPKVEYRALYDYGPDGMWTATVRVLVPDTDATRKLFTGLRVPDNLAIFRVMDPDFSWTAGGFRE